MNTQTKIVVIRMKWLIAGAAVIAAAIIALILLFMSSGNSSEQSNTKITGAKTTSANASSASGTSTASAESSNNSTITYVPGVYTASVMLDGNPIDIKVTLDKENINSIEMIYQSDVITTMYPMLNESFNELADAVKSNGSTQNVAYSSDSKYTASMLLSGIEAALSKGRAK